MTSLKEQTKRKDSNLRSLEAKFNERKARLDTLNSDNQVLDDQLVKSLFHLSREILTCRSLLLSLLAERIQEGQRGIGDEEFSGGTITERVQRTEACVEVDRTCVSNSVHLSILELDNDKLLQLTEELENYKLLL